MLPGTAISLWSDVPVAPGAVRLDDVTDFAEGTIWWEAVGDDRGGCTLILPFESRSVPFAALGNIVRFVDFDGNGIARPWEYRIVGAQDSADKTQVTITGQGLINRLADVVIRQVVGGLPSFAIAIDALTPAQILDAILIPALGQAGMGYITRGAVTPQSPLTSAAQTWTCLSLATWLEQQTSYELTLDPTPTGYALGLMITGSSAPSPNIEVGRNVAVLDRELQWNQNFMTRIRPVGDTLSGDAEPTDAREAAWDVVNYTGHALTLADPEARVSAIGSTDQYTGRYALAMIDPVLVPRIGTTIYGLAYDPTRHVVWITHSGASEARWVSLVDGSTGAVAVTAGNTVVGNIAYAASSDRVYVGCGTGNAVQVIDPSTKTVTATITTAANAGRVRYVPAFDAIAVSEAGKVEIVNPATNAVAGTLTGANINAASIVQGDLASSRYFVAGDSANGTLYWFNASTYAAVGNTNAMVGGGGIANFGMAGGVGYLIDNLKRYGMFLASAPASATPVAIPAYGAEAIAPVSGGPLTIVGSTIYLAANFGSAHRYLAATKWDQPSGSFAYTTDVFGDVGLANSEVAYDPALDAFVLANAISLNAVSAGAHVRVLRRGAVTAPQEGFVVQATDAIGQTVSDAAGDVGVYQFVRKPRVEFRASAALERVPDVADAGQVAAYGNVDGSVSVSLLGKRNYARLGTFDEWRSDRTSRWLAAGYPDATTYGTPEEEWDSADVTAPATTIARTGAAFSAAATSMALWGLSAGFTVNAGDLISTSPAPTPDVSAVAASAVTADSLGHAVVRLATNTLPALAYGTTIYVIRKSNACTVGTGGYVAGALSIAVSGLSAGQVLQPGDLLADGALGSAAFAIVRLRTVADGSGNAAVAITKQNLGNHSAGAALTLYQPQRLPTSGKCVALYPTTGPGTSMTFPAYHTAIAIPRLTSETTAYVVAHVQMMGAGQAAWFGMQVTPPYANAALATVAPTDATAYNDGVPREYWLVQPVSLDVGAGVISVSLGMVGADQFQGTVYVQSLTVHFGSSAITDRDVHSGDGQLFVAIANAALSVHAQPAVTYTVQATEDDPDVRYVLGATAHVRDVARGLDTTARLVRIERDATEPDRPTKLPRLTVSTQPLSTLAQIVALQSPTVVGGVSAYAAPSTAKGALTSLALAPATVTLAAGGTQTFVPTGKDADGNTVAIVPQFDVVSGGGSINASTGVFTAGTTAGTYPNTIRCTAGGLIAYASVVVSAGAAVALQVTPSPVYAATGDTVQMACVGIDANGNQVPVTPTWSVLNPSAGTINAATGLLTCGAVAGSYAASVEATVGALTATADVTLVAGAGFLAGIAVSPSVPQIAANGTQRFSAAGFDGAGAPYPLGAIVWSVANAAAGMIDQTGKFTASTTSGTYQSVIRATSGGVTGYATIQIVAGAVATVKVSPSQVEIGVTGTQDFTAQALDAYGNVIANPTFAWGAVNGGVTIDAQGHATAGTVAGSFPATVQASVNGVSGTANVTVNPGALAALTIRPNPDHIAMGATDEFHANGADQYGNAVATGVVTWAAVAGGVTITGDGVATAIGPVGEYDNTVQASVGAIVATATVIVTSV